MYITYATHDTIMRTYVATAEMQKLFYILLECKQIRSMHIRIACNYCVQLHTYNKIFLHTHAAVAPVRYTPRTLAAVYTHTWLMCMCL